MPPEYRRRVIAGAGPRDTRASIKPLATLLYVPRVIAMLRVEDPYGRPLTNIRLVLTDECNYKCIFCHMEGEPLQGPKRPGKGSPLLLAEHYYIISRAAHLLGVSKFKLTGGEPLLRGDIVEIVESIRDGAPGSEISMTTNGYLLERLAGKLWGAGLRRVNISIHSLKPERYEFITGVPGLSKAQRGLRAAVSAGLGVKINMVVLRGVNDDEVLSMADFAHSAGAVLQLIELHPVGLGARFFKRYFYPLKRVEEELLRLGASVSYRKDLHNRPVYRLPSGAVIEIVRPFNNPLFCAGCTRIRIGPYGDISPCINWKGPRPVLSPILKSDLPLEEKIARVGETLIDVVASRVPYYLCTLKNCDGQQRPARIRRISLRKRASYEKAKKELRSLLARAATQQSRVPSA